MLSMKGSEKRRLLVDQGRYRRQRRIRESEFGNVDCIERLLAGFYGLFNPYSSLYCDDEETTVTSTW